MWIHITIVAIVAVLFAVRLAYALGQRARGRTNPDS
jgi:steroid 5-alpha reductase family enzyme